MMKFSPMESRTDSKSLDSLLKSLSISGPILTPLYSFHLAVQGLFTQAAMWERRIGRYSYTHREPAFFCEK